ALAWTAHRLGDRGALARSSVDILRSAENGGGRHRRDAAHRRARGAGGAESDFLARARIIFDAREWNMRRRFATLDVFTGTRFAGNPLAVVHESDGLDAGVMQAIAREFNLSETVFVLPAANGAHRARVRIFTPAIEIPFAGHPTIGTAVLLGLLDRG